MRAICFYSRAPANKLGGQTVEAFEVSIFHSVKILLRIAPGRVSRLECGNHFLTGSYRGIVRSAYYWRVLEVLSVKVICFLFSLFIRPRHKITKLLFLWCLFVIKEKLN